MEPSVRYYKVIGVIQRGDSSQERIYRAIVISSKVDIYDHRENLTREKLISSEMKYNPIGRWTMIDRFVLNYRGPSWTDPGFSAYNTDAEELAHRTAAKKIPVEISRWFKKKCDKIPADKLKTEPIEISFNLQMIKVR